MLLEGIEVELKTEANRAVIAGKTSVPFKTFVSLVLQRKVFHLFKTWGNEPVIVGSELLTGLASAPQDSPENRTHLVLVTLGVGVLAGVFAAAVIQVVLLVAGIALGLLDLLLVAGSLVGLALLAAILSKVQRGNRAQKVADTMEKVAGLLSK